MRFCKYEKCHKYGKQIKGQPSCWEGVPACWRGEIDKLIEIFEIRSDAKKCEPTAYKKIKRHWCKKSRGKVFSARITESGDAFCAYCGKKISG